MGMFHVQLLHQGSRSAGGTSSPNPCPQTRMTPTKHQGIILGGIPSTRTHSNHSALILTTGFLPILCQKKKHFKQYLRSVMKEIYGCLMKLFPRSLGAGREQFEELTKGWWKTEPAEAEIRLGFEWKMTGRRSKDMKYLQSKGSKACRCKRWVIWKA